MELGAKVTASTVEKIMLDNAEAIDQLQLSEGNIKSAPKIFKNDCEINWSEKVAMVHNFIRGLSPYPAAWCTLSNTKGEKRTFKIFKGKSTSQVVNDRIHLLKEKDGILFPCGDYYYKVTELQPEGKRRMNFNEFLAGNSLNDWTLYL
jgi:methionyl-tRNA formyltransferase